MRLIDRIWFRIFSWLYLPPEPKNWAPVAPPPPPEGWHDMGLPPVAQWPCICPDRRRGVHRPGCKADHTEEEKS